VSRLSGRYDGRSVKRRSPEADDDSMRSVADIPGDADDDLSEISPELVLIDPELARRVREREPPPDTGRSTRALLRIVRPEDRRRVTPPPPIDAPDEPDEAAAPPAAPAQGELVAPAPPAEPVVAREEPRPAPPDIVVDAAPAPPPLPPPPVVDDHPAREDIARPVAAEIVARFGPAPAASPQATPSPPGDEPREPVPDEPRVVSAMPHPVARPSRSAHAARPSRAPGRSRRWLVVLGGLAVAAIAALGVLNLGDRSPETPRTAAPGPRNAAAAKPKPTSGTKRSTRGRASPTSKASGNPTPPAARPKQSAASDDDVRRLAWAPVAGAVGYHVELLRGSERVLVTQTTKPELELGPNRRYAGHVVRLTPGTYRWYVWPVTKTGRAAQTVVQAQLSVP
jgi:hypothetical protein